MACSGMEGNTLLCLDAAAMPCPEGDDAKAALGTQLAVACCAAPDDSICIVVAEVHCGPMPQVPDQCCYAVTVADNGCATPGRPLVIDDVIVRAPVTRGDDAWCSVLTPDVTGLDVPTRAQLADRWTDDALMEHAAVASFSRMALSLMALGAPPRLIDGCHRAARQEIGHARDAFALASAYAGEARGPGRLPLPQDLPLANSFETLARETLREGCINETAAAVAAAERLACATDPVVRRALTRITREEGEHAELAWRCLRWLLSHGGAEVREVLTAELARLRHEGGHDIETITQVIVPCLQGLLQPACEPLPASGADAGGLAPLA
jgi:hypothetical protein